MSCAPSFLTGLHTFFIRLCYEEIYELIEKKIVADDQLEEPTIGKFGITGTPGIGKSLFLMYFISRWLWDKEKHGRTIVLETRAGCFYIITISTRPECVRASSEDSVLEYLNENERKADFLLVDGKVNDMPPFETFGCRMLWASSPKNGWYKEIMKDSSVRLYMPIWNMSEMEKCWKQILPDKISEEEFKKRVEEVGMIPRFVFRTDQSRYNQDWSDVEKSASSEIKPVVNISDIERMKPTVHRVFHMDEGGVEGGGEICVL